MDWSGWFGVSGILGFFVLVVIRYNGFIYVLCIEIVVVELVWDLRIFGWLGYNVVEVLLMVNGGKVVLEVLGEVGVGGGILRD